jgi:2-methylcitrate dehydratase PrpD
VKEHTSSLTSQLAQLVTGSLDQRYADRWLDIAERAFVDTVGVLVAGSREPAVRLVAELVDEHDGRVACLSTGTRMSARSAALVDGTSAHALDYDDVDDALVAHVSAVLVPALLAAGQQKHATGADLLDAFRVGVEAARAVGLELGIPSHYQAGWHSTGTVGTIGAAAAVSRLLRLDESGARCALGIAGSLAGGSRQNFGTMTKALHVGEAASNGLSAAYLAVRGFTADPDQLDGPLGFLALHRGTEPAPAVLGVPAATEEPLGLNVKMLPCCYATHEAAEAAVEVAARIGTEAKVQSVEVAVHPGGLSPLIHNRPADGIQAKFSMEYVVAAALLDGRITFASFDDDRVRSRDVQDLLDAVTITTTDLPPAGPAKWDGRFAVVTARASNGASYTARVDRAAGHVSRPLSELQLRAKFDDCVLRTSTRATEAAYSALRHLRHRPSATQVADAVVGLRDNRQEPDS